MKYRIVQLWYQITCPVLALYRQTIHRVSEWFEWMDAKYWAKDIRPAWLQMATKCKNKSTRDYYKAKILAAYREVEDA